MSAVSKVCIQWTLRLWQNKLLNLKSKSKLNEIKITFFSAESFDFIWFYHAVVTCYKIMSTHTKIISNFSFTVNIQFPWILGIQMTGLILLAVKSKSGTKLNDFKNDFYTCCRKTHMFVHLKLYPKYSFIRCTKFWNIFLINFYGLYMSPPTKMEVWRPRSKGTGLWVKSKTIQN